MGYSTPKNTWSEEIDDIVELLELWKNDTSRLLDSKGVYKNAPGILREKTPEARKTRALKLRQLAERLNQLAIQIENI